MQWLRECELEWNWLGPLYPVIPICLLVHTDANVRIGLPLGNLASVMLYYREGEVFLGWMKDWLEVAGRTDNNNTRKCSACVIISKRLTHSKGSIDLDPIHNRIIITSDFLRSQKRADNEEMMRELEVMAERGQSGDYVLHRDVMTRFVAKT